MKQSVNFYHPRFRPVGSLAAAAVYGWLLFLVVALLTATVWAWVPVDALQGQVDALEQEQNTFHQRYEAQTSAVGFAQGRTAGAVPSARSGVQEAIPRHPAGFSSLLKALAQAKVSGAWLERLSVTDYGRAVELVGKSSSATAWTSWLQRLTSLPELGMVAQSDLDIVWNAENQELTTFTVRWRQAAPR